MTVLNYGLLGRNDRYGSGKQQPSPLRQRFIEDMDLAGLSEATQKTYISVISAMQNVLKRRPDRLTEEEIRRYLIWLREEKGVAKGTFQTYFFGLKFFYYRTLNLDWSLFTKKKCACQIRSASQSRFRGKIAAA